MDPKPYFAYGSNMLRERLLYRHVVLLDRGEAAQIDGHSLNFNKWSTKGPNGSSKANLVEQPGETSWGVLFSVDSNSLTDLRRAEGYPDHYREATIVVDLPTGPREAMVYLAQPGKVLPPPDRPCWDWYLALMLAGAKACPGVPPEWIKHLRQIASFKESHGQPVDDFTEAVAQLKAAGHQRWRDLLINPTYPIL